MVRNQSYVKVFQDPEGAAGVLINCHQLVLKTIRLKKRLGKVELKRTDIPIHCRLVAISFKWHFLYYFASLILEKKQWINYSYKGKCSLTSLLLSCQLMRISASLLQWYEAVHRWFAWLKTVEKKKLIIYILYFNKSTFNTSGVNQQFIAWAKNNQPVNQPTNKQNRF